MMKSRPSKFESLNWDTSSADPLFAVSAPDDATPNTRIGLSVSQKKEKGQRHNVV
jgi:hypothetical protein